MRSSATAEDLPEMSFAGQQETYLNIRGAEAVPLATQATSKMMAEVLGFRGEAGYYFEVINGYVYNCLNTRTTLQYGVGGILGTSKILRYGKARWGEVQAKSRAAADNRRQDPLRRKWFRKLLRSAQDCAPIRENAIAYLGLTYPQIRRLLRELGRRLVAGGALGQADDVY